MTARRCSVPGCQGEAADFFCTTHYIALPPKQAQFLFRWQFKMRRCEDADTKEHMRDTLHGYVQEAVRALQQSGATASQATPDSARRFSSPPCVAAGATNPQTNFI